MLERFKKHIEQNFNELLTCKTLLTVSGGVDSMVLLHLFQQTHLNFVVAHCNFQLRETESDLDEKLVRDYCLQNNIVYFVNNFNTVNYASLNKVSIQIAARDLRYKWFDELSATHGFNFIATAHHLDDQAETFLINFTRGTGIDGLVGIPEKNGKVIRPLLPFSRDKIICYAKENEIIWREDASNATTKYLRNKIRHKIVPILKEENPQFLNSFQSTLNHLQEAQFLAAQAMNIFIKECVSETENRVEVNLEKALTFNQPFVYLTHFLKQFGFDNVNEIKKICNAGTGKVLNNAKFTLLNNRNSLQIIDNLIVNNEYIYINDILDVEKYWFIMKITEVSEFNFVSDKNIIFVNSNLLKWPLVLRKYKTGDVFQPFGLKGFKKVSKFYKDLKLSQFQKQEQWILENGDGNIIWIVGLRADDRFKVTNNKSKIYKLTTN